MHLCITRTMLRGAGTFPTNVLSGAQVLFGLLNLQGENLPALEIGTICQGHKKFGSFF